MHSPQIPPREPPAPAVRQPEVAQAPRHDTMAPAIRVQPEAKWWRRTQRQTAPVELGPTPRQESGQAGKPEVRQPSEPGNMLGRTFRGEIGPQAPIPEYTQKTLSRLADNSHTCDTIQYTFRKAGLDEAEDVVPLIEALERRANEMGLDPQTAQKAVHSHLEREAAAINHMKDKLGLDWDGVRQVMREPSKFEGGAFENIAEAHEHAALASYLRSIEKAGIELSSAEGYRARVEAARKAHQDGINYVKQLQENWSRGGLKSLDDYAKSSGQAPQSNKGESGSD